MRPFENPNPTKPFSNPAEAEFARLLDFYGIPWIYQPTTFPLAVDAEGNIAESLTPNFYLPSENQYFELTLRQHSSHNDTNGKIRMLKEMYPDVRIKLLSRRSMRSLFEKYGIAAEELSRIEIAY